MKHVSVGFVLATLAISIVGMVDTAFDDEWTRLALFAVVAVLQSAMLFTARGRSMISLRPDLARWAHERAQRTGEPVETITDRAIAWYRHGLYRPNSPDVN